MSFTLKALNPGSVYEAIVQAKNRYGWNEVSDDYAISWANYAIDQKPYIFYLIKPHPKIHNT